MELSDEDIERIEAGHPHNFVAHLQRVRRLLKHAKPGNIPWMILENEYGFQGDWSPADTGMHWYDNEIQD
jgi:hypothetical protein